MLTRRLKAIIPRLRSSFGLKLLAALLASVGLVLLVALLVVREETERQVDRVADRMTVRSREAFGALEELKQAQLAQLGSAFTETRRTLAGLEAALESSKLELLIEDVRYELQLKRLTQSLVVFTDTTARPVLTLRDGVVLAGDPADVRSAAGRLLADGSERVNAYRAVGDQLFAVQLQRLELGGVAIGTVALGVPVDDAAARDLGEVLGAELCFVIANRCMAGTPVARAELGNVMGGVDARSRGSLVYASGRRWRVIAEDLSPGYPADGRRTLAVPMDEVLEPLERIQRALIIAGAFALGLAIVLGILLSRGLSGPVRDLVRATARVASGNYGVRVPVRSTDEIGQLAVAFNTMTEGLELKERYRGVLDKVVSRDVAEELLASDILLGGETREVTTLFVDVSSFTPLTEGMEPQRVIRLVNDIMSRLGAVVEEHGGVVDKYLGDGLMALFGAPVHHPDHAARAVRAAIQMQDEMAGLDRERVARGETPIRIAVGIHTGPAVAGNVGSPNRLNYTAVGSSVNLAMRLCQGAGPGEILVSEAVFMRATVDSRESTVDSERINGDDRGVSFRTLGARSFKGFSRPLEVYAVEPATTSSPPTEDSHAHAAVMGSLPARLFLGLCWLCTAVVPAPTAAQGALPTLADLGLRYQSPSGRFQIDLSGRLDIEGYFPQEDPPWVIPSTDPFVAGRLRLFTDVFAGERLYALVEIRGDRGERPQDGPVQARVEQAFIRVALPLPARLQLQVGKFASPVGSYPERHHTPGDPLIRPPILYDHHTVIDVRSVPAAKLGFFDWKNDPIRRPAGTPVIWGVPYPWGAALAGGVGKLDLRVALTSTAPSSPPETWDFNDVDFDRPSIVFAAGYPVVPELRLNGYYSRGPFLQELRAGTLPAGTELSDFLQTVWGGEAVFARGPATLRAEAFTNQWELPNIPDDVRDLSYSVEAAYKLTAGLFAAARFGEIRFNELSELPGVRPAEDWDHDIRRIQLGAGYRFLRNTEFRVEYLFSRTAGANDPQDDLFSLQWWWSF
jgi:class 3 adenylate cyclase